VNKPPSSTIYSFVYDFNTTVKVALISLLKDATNSSVGPNEKFGLYYPMKGIWLDESKTLEYYDIDPQVIIFFFFFFFPIHSFFFFFEAFP